MPGVGFGAVFQIERPCLDASGEIIPDRVQVIESHGNEIIYSFIFLDVEIIRFPGQPCNYRL